MIFFYGGTTMKTALQKLRRVLNTKLGFFLLVVLLFCLKSYWAYQNEFNLGVKGSMQQFLLAFNTIPSALVFLGIALYFRGRLSYWMMLIINVALSTWLLQIFCTIENFRISLPLT